MKACRFKKNEDGRVTYRWDISFSAMTSSNHIQTASDIGVYISNIKEAKTKFTLIETQETTEN